MASFSGAVKLANVDDYLAPSAACIKPVLDGKESVVEAPTKANKGATIKIELEDVPAGAHFNQIRLDDSKKSATVSLNDCLACSGCVTSAETVLIQQQSSAEFLSHLNGDKTVVVSVSPQSRAALAKDFNLSALQTAKKLTTFFKSLGVKYILDTSSSLDFALLEAQREFVERYKAQQSLPLLSSECPGWICYAEKVQGERILPHLSYVKSPQQIMGTIVKKHLAKRLGLDPSSIYHVTIMPCYDKKLEASRDDFFDPLYQTRDVDCVLASSELRDLLRERNVDLAALSEAALDPEFSNVSASQDAVLTARAPGASGGYLDHIYRYAAKELFGVEVKGDLEYKVNPRNADFKEVKLMIGDEVVLHFALAYGFRNIQNLMTKMKQNRASYHYVEVMACPSGCLNGGGQIKAANIKEQKQLVKDLETIFHQHEVREPDANPTVKEFYQSHNSSPGSDVDSTKHIFRTQFHAITNSNENPLAAKW